MMEDTGIVVSDQGPMKYTSKNRTDPSMSIPVYRYLRARFFTFGFAGRGVRQLAEEHAKEVKKVLARVYLLILSWRREKKQQTNDPPEKKKVARG
jgi:hypothetical protein